MCVGRPFPFDRAPAHPTSTPRLLIASALSHPDTQPSLTRSLSVMKSSKQFQTTWVTVWVASADTHGERKLDLDATIGQLKVRAPFVPSWL